MNRLSSSCHCLSLYLSAFLFVDLSLCLSFFVCISLCLQLKGIILFTLSGYTGGLLPYGLNTPPHLKILRCVKFAADPYCGAATWSNLQKNLSSQNARKARQHFLCQHMQLVYFLLHFPDKLQTVKIGSFFSWVAWEGKKGQKYGIVRFEGQRQRVKNMEWRDLRESPAGFWTSLDQWTCWIVSSYHNPLNISSYRINLKHQLMMMGGVTFLWQGLVGGFHQVWVEGRGWRQRWWRGGGWSASSPGTGRTSAWSPAGIAECKLTLCSLVHTHTLLLPDWEEGSFCERFWPPPQWNLWSLPSSALRAPELHQLNLWVYKFFSVWRGTWRKKCLIAPFKLIKFADNFFLSVTLRLLKSLMPIEMW